MPPTGVFCLYHCVVLWMHYLMSSQRRDYAEMKECVLAVSCVP